MMNLDEETMDRQGEQSMVACGWHAGAVGINPTDLHTLRGQNIPFDCNGSGDERTSVTPYGTISQHMEIANDESERSKTRESTDHTERSRPTERRQNKRKLGGSNDIDTDSYEDEGNFGGKEKPPLQVVLCL